MTAEEKLSDTALLAKGLFAVAEALRELGLILAGAPLFVRKPEAEQNQYGRCATCNGTGMLQDASYCMCPTGQDLRHVERFGQ